MPTQKEDQKYLQTALPEIKNYLLSDILYYPLTGNLPRLTLGGILLAQRRLGIFPDPQFATVKETWRAAWTSKASRELDARLTLWRNYLDDYRQDPATQAQNYPHEVRWRVMIALLIPEAESAPKEIESLDRFLHANFRSGAFLWNKTQQEQFPQDEFWFLYGNLRKE
jgi:hypothetical protein